MIDPSKLIDAISRIAPRTLLAITIAAGAILFAPQRFVQALRLTFLRDTYGPWGDETVTQLVFDTPTPTTPPVAGPAS